MLKSLTLKNYRCFSDITIPFKENTLLIGTNGVGKTSIFSLLGKLKRMAIGVNKEDKSLYLPFIDQLISISDFKDTDKELVISLEYSGDNEKIEKFYVEVENNGDTICINNSITPLSLSEELDKLIILYDMNTSSIGKYEYSESDHWENEDVKSTNSMEYLNFYLFKLVEEYPNSKELILKNLPFHILIKDFSFNSNGFLDVHLLDVSSNTIKKRSFTSLSSGEKVIFLASFLEAYTRFYSSILLWDNLDAYINVDEVGHFVMGLRRCYHSCLDSGYQLIVSSNTEEGIRKFSDENTVVLCKSKDGNSCSLLEDLEPYGDLTSRLILGEWFCSEDFCKALLD